VEINNLSSAQRSAAYPSEARRRSEELRVQDSGREDDAARETPARNAAPEKIAEEQAPPPGPRPRGSLIDIAV